MNYKRSWWEWYRSRYMHRAVWSLAVIGVILLCYLTQASIEKNWGSLLLSNSIILLLAGILFEWLQRMERRFQNFKEELHRRGLSRESAELIRESERLRCTYDRIMELRWMIGQEVLHAIQEHLQDAFIIACDKFDRDAATYENHWESLNRTLGDAYKNHLPRAKILRPAPLEQSFV